LKYFNRNFLLGVLGLFLGYYSKKGVLRGEKNGETMHFIANKRGKASTNF
jgi:hypothetical protein